jgi:hypothetical protein
MRAYNPLVLTEEQTVEFRNLVTDYWMANEANRKGMPGQLVICTEISMDIMHKLTKNHFGI